MNEQDFNMEPLTVMGYLLLHSCAFLAEATGHTNFSDDMVIQDLRNAAVWSLMGAEGPPKLTESCWAALKESVEDEAFQKSLAEMMEVVDWQEEVTDG